MYIKDNTQMVQIPHHQSAPNPDLEFDCHAFFIG